MIMLQNIQRKWKMRESFPFHLHIDFFSATKYGDDYVRYFYSQFHNIVFLLSTFLSFHPD